MKGVRLLRDNVFLLFSREIIITQKKCKNLAKIIVVETDIKNMLKRIFSA